MCLLKIGMNDANSQQQRTEKQGHLDSSSLYKHKFHCSMQQHSACGNFLKKKKKLKLFFCVCVSYNYLNN